MESSERLAPSRYPHIKSTDRVARRRVIVMARLIVAALAAAALAGVSPAAAAPVVPPPGTPDLSQMVLQPADFSDPGSIDFDAYDEPPSEDVVAVYDRLFSDAKSGSSSLIAVESTANLVTDEATAEGAFGGLNQLARSKSGRRALLASFISGFNKGTGGKHKVKFRDLRFRRVHSLGLGDESFVLPASFTYRRAVHVYVDTIYLRVDRVIAMLQIGNLGKIKPATDKALAGAVADHIRAVLAAPVTPTPSPEAPPPSG
jgi:hypothetical protein